MSEIRVEWRRVLNLAPYETETIVLGITETIDVKPISARLEEAEARAATLAKLHRVMFDKIAEAGASIVIEHLKTRAAASAPRAADPPHTEDFEALAASKRPPPRRGG